MGITLVVVFFGIFLLLGLNQQSGYPGTDRRLNVWFGPRPRHGERQIRFTLRDAGVTLAFLALSMTILRATRFPDEGAEFLGNESLLVGVLVIFLGCLSVLAIFKTLGCALTLVFLVLFRRKAVFDIHTRQFVKDVSLLSALPENSNDFANASALSPDGADP